MMALTRRFFLFPLVLAQIVASAELAAPFGTPTIGPTIETPPSGPPALGAPRTAVVLGVKGGAPEAPLGTFTDRGESPGSDEDCPLGNVPIAQVPRNRRRLGGKDPTGSCSQGCDPDGDGKVYNVGGDYMGTVESVCPCARASI